MKVICAWQACQADVLGLAEWALQAFVRAYRHKPQRYATLTCIVQNDDKDNQKSFRNDLNELDS